MTATTAPRVADRLAPLQAVAVAGSVVVFLLAAAALANLVLSPVPIPQDLRHASVAAHLASVMTALPLAVSQLVLPKGTLRHRIVGYVWIALMVFTALVSFSIHSINKQGLSPVHLFSALTLICAPIIVWEARRGRVERHRRVVLLLVIGGLVIAGLFTFVPNRALGHLLAALVNGGQGG
jgi:uncharacterized membrane protein